GREELPRRGNHLSPEPSSGPDRLGYPGRLRTTPRKSRPRPEAEAAAKRWIVLDYRWLFIGSTAAQLKLTSRGCGARRAQRRVERVGRSTTRSTSRTSTTSDVFFAVSMIASSGNLFG